MNNITKKLFSMLVLILVTSCTNHDKKKIIITDFNAVFTDSLEPNKSRITGYSMYNIYIKGYANDSIKIKASLRDNDSTYSFFYKDTIDTRLYFDYYGDSKRYMYFDPYKATKGNLQIKYSLD